MRYLLLLFFLVLAGLTHAKKFPISPAAQEKIDWLRASVKNHMGDKYSHWLRWDTVKYFVSAEVETIHLEIRFMPIGGIAMRPHKLSNQMAGKTFLIQNKNGHVRTSDPDQPGHIEVTKENVDSILTLVLPPCGSGKVFCNYFGSNELLEKAYRIMQDSVDAKYTTPSFRYDQERQNYNWIYGFVGRKEIHPTNKRRYRIISYEVIFSAEDGKFIEVDRQIGRWYKPF